MPEVRYTLPGVPALHAGRGTSAFLPQLTQHAGGGHQSYKYALVGLPGTGRVPAPRPAGVPQDRSGQASMGTARSCDAPDSWYPQEYYQAVAVERPGAGMPVKIYDPTRPGLTTVLPAPAVDYRPQYQADSARLARRTLLQRVKAMPWFPQMTTPETGTWNG